jgi:hypothetical protein
LLFLGLRDPAATIATKAIACSCDIYAVCGFLYFLPPFRRLVLCVFLVLVFFLVLGHPVTAILVVRVIWAPFCPVRVGGRITGGGDEEQSQ